MRLPDLAIRTSLKDALDGIVYGAVTVPVSATYNQPAEVFPRIIVESISTFENGAKGCFMFESTVTILVQDRRKNVDSTDSVEVIADQITQILAPETDGHYPELDSFEIWIIQLRGSQTQLFDEGNFKYTSKSLTFTIKSEQI